MGALSDVASIVSAVAAIGSVWFAYRTVVASGDAAAQQSVENERERALADYAVLVRDPMLARLEAARRQIGGRIGDLNSLLHNLFHQGTLLGSESANIVGRAVEACIADVQRSVLDLRTDLAVIAIAANEHDLWEGLSRQLEKTEDKLVERIAATLTDRGIESPNAVDSSHLIAEVQRQVVLHGKTLKRKPLARLQG